jgi:hypothetical protein
LDKPDRMSTRLTVALDTLKVLAMRACVTRFLRNSTTVSAVAVEIARGLTAGREERSSRPAWPWAK